MLDTVKIPCYNSDIVKQSSNRRNEMTSKRQAPAIAEYTVDGIGGEFYNPSPTHGKYVGKVVPEKRGMFDNIDFELCAKMKAEYDAQIKDSE